MTKTFIGFNKKTAAALTKGFERPIEKNKKFFSLLSILIDQSTQLTFRTLGARAGHPAWPGYSELTLHPSSMRGGQRVINRNKWNRRRGTDNSKSRKYSANSRMLQASGGFRKTFGAMSIKKGQLIYGIKGVKMRNLGRDIMSDPERQVLFVNSQDRKQWGRLFRLFIDKGIKF